MHACYVNIKTQIILILHFQFSVFSCLWFSADIIFLISCFASMLTLLKSLFTRRETEMVVTSYSVHTLSARDRDIVDTVTGGRPRPLTFASSLLSVHQTSGATHFLSVIEFFIVRRPVDTLRVINMASVRLCVAVLTILLSSETFVYPVSSGKC